MNVWLDHLTITECLKYLCFALAPICIFWPWPKRVRV